MSLHTLIRVVWLGELAAMRKVQHEWREKRLTFVECTCLNLCFVPVMDGRTTNIERISRANSLQFSYLIQVCLVHAGHWVWQIDCLNRMACMRYATHMVVVCVPKDKSFGRFLHFIVSFSMQTKSLQHKFILKRNFDVACKIISAKMLPMCRVFYSVLRRVHMCPIQKKQQKMMVCPQQQ